MGNETNDYSQYADHPRFGRGPRFTGLNPNPMNRGIHLHWNSKTHEEIVTQWEAATGENWPYGNLITKTETRVPNTAIVANPERFGGNPMFANITHYFDLHRRCADCKLWFIFFAQEQKYWYEVLKLPLEADAVRCVACRKHQQHLARVRKRFDALSHVQERTTDENIEMADCCLTMIEAGIFGHRQLQRVRMLLNRIPTDADQQTLMRRSLLKDRVKVLEAT